jgi:G3E family GTPase
MKPETETETQVPVTVIGGFLGAGKTTYLNLLIGEGLPADTLIVVNDFGEINIDASLIEFRSDRLIQLQNGCICCTIGGTLAEQLAAVVRWPQPPARVVIEASGVARPGRIADIARVSSRFKLASVVTLIDAPALAHQLADKRTGDLVQAQIREADELLLNKAQRLSQQERRQVSARVRALNPASALTWAPAAMTPAAVPVSGKPRPDHRHPLATGPLVSFSLESGALKDLSSVEQILLDHADTLVRAKGKVLVSRETPATHILQYANGEVRWSPSLRPAARTQIVCIGYQSPRLEELRQRLVSLSEARWV